MDHNMQELIEPCVELQGDEFCVFNGLTGDVIHKGNDISSINEFKELENQEEIYILCPISEFPFHLYKKGYKNKKKYIP